MADSKDEIILKLKIEENRALRKLKEVKESVGSLDRRTTKYKNTVREQVALESKLISIRKQRVAANKQMEGSVKKLTKAQEKGLSAAGASTSATLELGRVISDAPYGIRGMANNIQQLGSNLFFMSKKTDEVTGKTLGFKGAVGSLLGGLIGPAGLLIAFQGLIALWDYLGDGAKKAESDTRDFLAGISDLLEVQTDVNDKIEEYLVLQKLKKELDDDKKKSNEELRKIDVELLEIEKKKVNTLKLMTLNEEAYANSKDKSTTKAKGYLKNETANAKKLEELTTKENALNTKRASITGQYLEKLRKYREEKKKLTAVEADTLKGLKKLKKEKEEERELLSKTSEDYKRLTIAIDEYQKKIEEIEGKKKKGSGKTKKISPFKTPKELDIDVKNADNAVIQYEKRLQDARLKKELNDKLSEATSEEEKAKIRRNYERDRLINQMNAEEDILKLKKANEEAIVKTKTKNHTDELKRKFELFTTELDYQQKLGKISKEDSESLKSDAAGKLFDGLAQAQTEEKVSLDEISSKYKPIFTLFSSLKAARLDALFSKDSGEGSEDSTEMEKLEAFVSRYMEISGVLTDFMNGEFNRQLTIEQNKTNALNNELRERLNNENLSANERKDIQLRIARNDEALRRRQEQIKKKQFKLNKAANIASALVSTYSGASAAYFNTLKNPANALDPTAGLVRAKINAGVATALGLANVAMIARQKFQSSISTAPTAGALGGGGGSGSGNGDRSFNFNLAGASQENQLAQTLQGRFDQPLQAYVVSRDITNQQQLDMDIQNNASFG
jgi:hypothetical protein